MNMQLSAKTRPSNIGIYAPIYVAAFGAGAMALIALIGVMGATPFSLSMPLFLALGFCTSWLEKAGAIGKITRMTLVGIIIGISYIAAVMMPETRAIMYNPYNIGTNDPTVAEALAWLMGIYSFNLTSTKSILFLCVPALSIVGIAATLDPSTEVIVSFIAFIGFACFVLIQENSLDGPETAAATRFSALRTDSVRSYVGLSAGIAVLCVLVGTIFGSLAFRIISKNLSPSLAPNFFSAFSGDITSAQHFQPVSAGGASESDREVMRVTCSERLLWRGQVFNEYTGHGWIGDSDPADEAKVKPYKIFLRSPLPIWNGEVYAYRLPANIQPEPLRSFRSVRQIFEGMSGRSGMFLAAAQPKVIQYDSVIDLYASDGGLRIHHPYSVRISRPFGSKIAYGVTSDVSTATPDELRSAGKNYPAKIGPKYIRTPESCWRLKSLASRITAKEKTDYDKVIAIQNYLVDNYTYDLNTPASPQNEDAATHFLFVSKKGYCDIFSTSMVLMCRELGIPARWVTGYASGDFSNRDGKYHVKVKDQHAWVEVYFPSYGWITFDPTAGTREAGLSKRIRNAALQLKQMVLTGGISVVIISIATILAFYLLKVEFWDKLKPKKARVAAEISNARWRRHAETYRRMCRLLAKFGYPKQPELTPTEYAMIMKACLSPDLEHISEKVNAITADFEAARYSAQDVPEDRIAVNTALLDRMLKDLQMARKEKLLPSFCRK